MPQAAARNSSIASTDNLRSITEMTEAAPLAICREGGLEGSRQWHTAVGCSASQSQAGLCGSTATLALHVRLLHRRCQLDVLPQRAVLIFAAVHATLALLPLREGLCRKLNAELATGLPR